jgi:hypothetical protein
MLPGAGRRAASLAPHIINSISKKQTKAGAKMKNSKKGMELVQVAILIGIAVFIGLIFRNQINDFVTGIFGNLMGAGF